MLDFNTSLYFKIKYSYYLQMYPILFKYMDVYSYLSMSIQLVTQSIRVNVTSQI